MPSVPAPTAAAAPLSSPAGSAAAHPRAWFALVVLLVVYLMNFLDRTLIYVLFPLIKAELQFSDLQLALLGSTSFVIFYTSLGVPFGRLADRSSRRKLIAAGLVTWSVFSGLTGFAADFWTLFACRLMVGVGEATLGPAAMSLLSDLFPPNRRATAQSVYSAGIPLGAAAAFFLGSQIGAEWGWRAAFLYLGFPGVALAALVMALPEPARGATERAGVDSGSGQPGPSTAAPLSRNGPFLRMIFAFAVFAVAANCLSIWVPSLLGRLRGVPLPTIGTLAGVGMLVGGGLGTLLGGAAADAVRKRHPGGRLYFTAGLAAACVPLWLVMLHSSNLTVLAVTYTLLAAVGLAWLGPAAAEVHDLAGPTRRGLAIAVYFLAVNLIGYGLAPPAIGWLSDRLGGSADPRQLAVALLVAPACCAAAGVLLAVEGWRRGRGAASSETAPTPGRQQLPERRPSAQMR